MEHQSLFKENAQEQTDRSRENLMEVVRHLARGNMSLQYGWLQTEEDVDALRREFAGYDFRVKTSEIH